MWWLIILELIDQNECIGHTLISFVWRLMVSFEQNWYSFGWCILQFHLSDLWLHSIDTATIVIRPGGGSNITHAPYSTGWRWGGIGKGNRVSVESIVLHCVWVYGKPIVLFSQSHTKRSFRSTWKGRCQSMDFVSKGRVGFYKAGVPVVLLGGKRTKAGPNCAGFLDVWSQYRNHVNQMDDT